MTIQAAPLVSDNPYDRLSQCDPTGTVNLEDPQAVHAAIAAILDARYGAAYPRELLALGIDTTVAAYRGEHAGLLRCDTLYHDLRHALETGLTTARLIDGHARSLAADSPEQIDADHAVLGILLALFHDVGMLRRDTEAHLWGAVLMPVHEERGVEFMRAWLAQTVLAPLADEAELIMATKLIFHIPASWPAAHRLLASLIASADLLSQVADRCYLEKCRDFLFLEFGAVGLAGAENTPYPDRETLLAKTPGFYTGLVCQRLDEEYSGVHRLMARHFNGENPYEVAIRRNLDYLKHILASGEFNRLRRRPQVFVEASGSA